MQNAYSRVSIFFIANSQDCDTKVAFQTLVTPTCRNTPRQTSFYCCMPAPAPQREFPPLPGVRPFLSEES